MEESIKDMNVTIERLILVGNVSLDCIQFTCEVEPLNAMKYRHFTPDPVSTVGFRLELDRKYSKHILSYYLPSLLIVLLSWVSFVIPPEAIPGRMALLITLILVLVNMFGTVIDKRPPTNSTVLDIWMIGCLLFVFGSLMAYAALLLHQRFQIGKNLFSIVKRVAPPDTQSTNTGVKDAYDDYKQWDLYFLIAFPLIAFIFNLIYWATVFIKRQTL